jgi:hypothetical protein
MCDASSTFICTRALIHRSSWEEYSGDSADAYLGNCFRSSRTTLVLKEIIVLDNGAELHADCRHMFVEKRFSTEKR